MYPTSRDRAEVGAQTGPLGRKLKDDGLFDAEEKSLRRLSVLRCASVGLSEVLLALSASAIRHDGRVLQVTATSSTDVRYIRTLSSDKCLLRVKVVFTRSEQHLSTVQNLLALNDPMTPIFLRGGNPSLHGRHAHDFHG